MYLKNDFVADTRILNVLKDWHPDWLDLYVDKIIKQDNKNKNLSLTNEAFCKYTNPSDKSGYVDVISIEEYQYRRNALKKSHCRRKI